MKINKALILLLLLISCGNPSETPIEAANRLKNLACMGDIEGFYSHIDNGSVENSLQMNAVDGIEEEIGDDPSSIREFKEVILPSLIVLKWEVMSAEIANGQEGAFCNMQVSDSASNDGAVSIVYPDGKTSTWGFEEDSGQLILVSIIDEAPFDFAGLELEPHSKAKRSLQVKNEAPEQKEDSVIPEPEAKKQVDLTKTEDTASIKNEDKNIESAKDETLAQIKESTQTAKTDKKSSKRLSRPGYDFGSARWGMTKEQVMAQERSNPILDSSNMMKYNGRYNGRGAELAYVFSGNKLIRGRYTMRGPTDDEQAYIENYQNMKTLLSNRYGNPQLDQELWTNSIYKDNPERHGFAVYIGHLSYKSKWVTARSDIILELKSNNYNILLEAKYNRK